MKKMSKEEFVSKFKADMLAKEQAQIDASSAYCRYVQDKTTKRLRRKKKYIMEK